MGAQDRPSIPEEVKREVRQRCGYGCVMCGAQTYDYDHIVDYEIVQCHEVSNITLLCKHHHGEKTLKNLPKEVVEKANANPYNLRNDTTKSRYFYYSGKSVEVRIGGCICKYENLPDGFEFIPIQIDGTNIISFKTENDALLLSFINYERSNNKVIEIINNEVTHSTGVWDAEWEATKLTLREGNGRIILQLKFKTPNSIEITKGYFHYGYTDVILDDDTIFVANNRATINGGHLLNCRIGISIDGMGPYPESWQEIKKIMRKKIKDRQRRKSSGH